MVFLGIYPYFSILNNTWNVTRIGEMRNVYRLLTGKLEGNRPLGKPRYKWVVNIRINLAEI
jgi:hypothetical protein